MLKAITKVRSILVKEREDIFRNKRMLLIMFLFPIMYWIMSQATKELFANEGSAFVLMHIILVPIMIMASIVAEEKEKSTLKLLILSGVNTLEYIIGIMIIIMMCIILGLLAFECQGALRVDLNVHDVIIILFCTACSMTIGGIIGVAVPNQMSVGPVAVPVILIIFFMPVISIFQPKYKCITGLFYSSVVHDILKGSEITIERIGILALNFIVIAIFFSILFNRKRIMQDISKR